MPKERIVLDTNKIIKLYNSGKSINELANIFNVSRPTITRRLKNSGIVVRGQTEANQLMMSKRTIEENLHNVRAAHNAVRGKPRPREQKLKTAISRQANFTGYRSPYERDIANELIKRNIEFVPQFAIDIYNIDFAIGDNIAFEVAGTLTGDTAPDSTREAKSFSIVGTPSLCAGLGLTIDSLHPQ